MLTRLLLKLYSALGGSRWLRLPILERIYLVAFFSYKRFVEDPFAALLKRRPDLFSGGNILDVGANVGYTAAVFAGAVTDGFRVFAFEPEATNLRMMQRMLRRRGLEEKVVPVHAAVGAYSGSAYLAINPRHPGDHRIVPVSETGRTERVPMITIDDYVAANKLANVRFVKIDVQGLELSVSRGMERLLAESTPLAVVFEYSNAALREPGAQEDQLLSFYVQRGFTLQVIGRRGDLLPATPEAIDREHRRRGYGNILAVREGGI